MTLKFGSKEWLAFVIPILLLTDLAILLNIPFLRQILGFLFLTILPGLLILQILKLNKIEFTEKVVLSVGISISFLMFFGLLINNLSLSIGYLTPLSTISLLILFNIAFIALATIGYRQNKNPVFSLPNFNLSVSEKTFLIVPILLPALSISGIHLLNTADNNIILMFMLILIPIYIIFICIFNQKFPKRLYPAVIFLISLSLLLIYALRFSHIFGSDVHTEYYLFRRTLNNLHWTILGYTSLDACLSISLLPAIYQSILDINAQEYLFRFIYLSICSFSPLAIYVISKKYVSELYAFLASFFFISQSTFLNAPISPRTNIAIFFAALAVMVFFNDKIDPLKRRFLFILFILSVVVSHYTTAYIFFFVILFTWFVVEIFSKRYAFNKQITLTIVLLFFCFIFFWYSQVTETAFNTGVSYIESTFSNLNNLFVEELMNPEIEKLGGQGLTYPIDKVRVINTWATFILIGIGVYTMVRRYKEMVAISNVKLKKPDFLKTKFEIEYLTMASIGAGLLVAVIVLPYISRHYSLERMYSFIIIILSICFIIGSITLSKQTFKKSLIKNLSLKKKALPKKQKKAWKDEIGKEKGNRKSVSGKNTSQVRAYLIILLILIPYFLFETDMMDQIFGPADGISLNIEGGRGYAHYVHDQDSCAAKWLKGYAETNCIVYTDVFVNREKLISQGEFSPRSAVSTSYLKYKKGYIYLSYSNVVNGKLVTPEGVVNMSDCADVFVGKDMIYDNGGSEVWRS